MANVVNIIVNGKQYDLNEYVGNNVPKQYVQFFEGRTFKSLDDAKRANKYANFARVEHESYSGSEIIARSYERVMMNIIEGKKPEPFKKPAPEPKPEPKVFKYKATSQEQLKKFIEKITKMYYEVMPKECTADMLTYRKEDTTIYIKIK